VTRWNLRDRVRRLPGGETLVHVLVFLVGLSFILLGLALSVLPGPLTIPPVLLGLVIWALEFDFAERWVDKAKDQAQDAWESAKRHPWRAGVVTGSGFLLLGVGLFLASKYELVDRAKDLVS
jgi:hypothetical protein